MGEKMPEIIREVGVAGFLGLAAVAIFAVTMVRDRGDRVVAICVSAILIILLLGFVGYYELSGQFIYAASQSIAGSIPLVGLIGIVCIVTYAASYLTMVKINWAWHHPKFAAVGFGLLVALYFIWFLFEPLMLRKLLAACLAGVSAGLLLSSFPKTREASK